VQQITSAGWCCFSGLDLGIRRDHAAFAIVGARAGRLRLIHLQSWAPGPGGAVSLMQVEEEVIEACLTFRPFRGCADLWQAAQMLEQLERRGIVFEGVAVNLPVLQEMAVATLEGFRDRNVDLWPDEGLLRDLHALRFVDRGTSFRLDSPRTKHGHGDKAMAFQLACLAASRVPEAHSAYLSLDNVTEAEEFREQQRRRTGGLPGEVLYKGAWVRSDHPALPQNRTN
jgi:hypothetical protein